MRVAVIGAGVIGITTAFELTRDGHEVTVFERTATAAEGASFATGGLLAPDWFAALASTSVSARSAAEIGARWFSWLKPKEQLPLGDPGPNLLNLAQYGAERLDELFEQLQLTVDSHQGLMVVWRRSKYNKRADDLLSRLKDMGSTAYRMGPDQARALELALNPETPLQGVLVLPDAWSVNCRQFSLLLRASAQQLGCRFEFGQPIEGILTGPELQLTSTRPFKGPDRFDAVMLCTGIDADALLAPLGVRLPWESWHGHSLSASVRENLDAPVAVVHDLSRQVSIARTGQRVRVSGPIAPEGRGPSVEAQFKELYAVLDDWFPGSIRLGSSATVQQWTGRVTSTPDGLPAVGPTGVPGVWVNAGHGAHGWVMACGSARLLADQVAGSPTAILSTAYHPARWTTT